jgi:homoserine O-acetyltransferase
MPPNQITFSGEFLLECGESLSDIDITYCTYGALNATKSNVVWICHALTGNADPADWWSGLVGEGKLFDPNFHFIVCANIFGSPYGTTSPLSICPNNGNKYGANFPLISVRDVAKAHRVLADFLKVDYIKLLIGGSLGGQQAMEWAISEPDRIKNLVLIATNAQHSAWGIAFNEAQRLAISAGENGLKAARAIAMLSYRSYAMYNKTQTDVAEKLMNFKAASYQQYQGEKLMKRFDAHCYISLTRTMDSHNVGRGRSSRELALNRIKAKTLVIGISSDLLFPIEEQQFLASHIPNGEFKAIESPYGHDGFLIENEQLSELIKKYI